MSIQPQNINDPSALRNERASLEEDLIHCEARKKFYEELNTSLFTKLVNEANSKIDQLRAYRDGLFEKRDNPDYMISVRQEIIKKKLRLDEIETLLRPPRSTDAAGRRPRFGNLSADETSDLCDKLGLSFETLCALSKKGQ